MYTAVQLCSWMMWIPDCSQSSAQKNFFSLKGFSEVGTGVMRGSSQECASQYAIRSAAAFDTCRLGMICLILDYIFTLNLLGPEVVLRLRIIGTFIPWATTLKPRLVSLCRVYWKGKKITLPSVHIPALLSIIPLLILHPRSLFIIMTRNSRFCLNRKHAGVCLTFILQKLASIFNCSTSFLAWPTLMVLFTGVSPFILSTTATCHRSYHHLPFIQHT